MTLEFPIHHPLPKREGRFSKARATFTAWIAAVMFLANPLPAQEAVEKPLFVDGHITAGGHGIELNWFDAMPRHAGSVTVNRRVYGRLGGASWKPLAQNLGPVMRYTDTTIKPGVAYEYQVLRIGRDIVDVGYWLAGTDLPARDARGTAYVIVDQTLAPSLIPRLDRFERDLRGDGWRVLRHLTPRGLYGQPAQTLQQAISIKSWLVEQYSKDPFGDHAIILIGHVPLVRSGRANPDGHDPKPHPTDLFYADMNGRWSADPDGHLMNNRVPGDFIEAQIGRIDFFPISGDDRGAEIQHIRAYLDKNHHWRMGLLGDLREAYGQSDHLIAEQVSLRNIVGPSAITQGGHHDVGERQPWLWGVDFGAWNGREYATNYRNKAVFAINFGSGKQLIGAAVNPMTAHLAQPWYTLALGWGGRPAWWLHHMALGGTIGTVHMRTVNNGRLAEPYRDSMDYFPTGLYLMRNPVWVNLMGDPTLRAFPLRPPLAAMSQPVAEGVALSWQASPDPDVLGYVAYRLGADGKTFRLNDVPVTELTLIDPDPQEGAGYMIRAYGRSKVYSGSFFNLSQGIYAAPNSGLTSAAPSARVSMRAASGQTTPLPEMFNSATDQSITAIISPPDAGQLSHDGARWHYQPRTGFTGTDSLQFSVSGPYGTSEAQLIITVVD